MGVPVEEKSGSAVNFFRGLVHTILHFFFAHTFSTLFVMLVVEEAGIPIPIAGDYLIALAGSQPHKPFVYGLLIIAISSVAVLLGSTLLFALAREKGRPVLDKYGKYILLEPKKVHKLEAWFLHYGKSALIFGRLIPGLRIPTTVVAGLSAISYRQYILYAGLAAVIWSSAYFYLGALLGRAWSRIFGRVTGFVDNVPRWLLITLIIALAIVIVWQNRRRLQRYLDKALLRVGIKKA